MHASSFENMERCVDLVTPLLLDAVEGPIRVLEVGSHDVNGSYRSLFTDRFSYLGADLGPGPNVDVVLEEPYRLPFEDGSLDLVVSGQMLEHSGRFWKTFAEMVRVISQDGFLVLIVPSAGPIHRYPVDCYRFYPDAYAALAEDAGVELLHVDHDTRGPWNDLSGIFSRRPQALPPRPRRRLSPSTPPAQLDPEADRHQGAKPYLKVLTEIHAALSPERYLEIGVRHGDSLRLAGCRSVAIDPFPDLATIDDTVSLFRETSDDFFRYDADQALEAPIDLAFIDGMHLFENVLRDFMHVEQRCSPGATIVIDDVLPNNAAQASRIRQTIFWSGDVWKITECLRVHRPDLSLTLIDSEPSGLLLVSGLDPTSRVLWTGYNSIVREFLSDDYATPPPNVLERRDAVHPDELWASERTDKTPAPMAIVDRRPALSVVVVAYNMAREIPRTLLSLSPQMQRGINPDDYEIIVVDNGSTQPFDRDVCSTLGCNITILDVETPNASPCRAINLGLAHAEGRCAES